MANFPTKYKPGCAGCYQMRLDGPRLLRDGYGNNLWRDHLDNYVGWQNWRYDKTTQPNHQIYIYLRDADAVERAMMAVGDYMVPMAKTNKLYKEHRDYEFIPVSRPFKTKRVTTNLYFTGCVERFSRDEQGFTLEVAREHVARALQGEHRVEATGLHDGGSEMFKLTTDDRLARNRIRFSKDGDTHFYGDVLEEEEVKRLKLPT